jgi:hypothetical protein
MDAPPRKTKPGDRLFYLILTLVFWLAAAWLLLPLVNLDRVDMSNVKSTIYRSALGLTLLIIFFGKTLLDLIFPWVHSRKLPVLNTILLGIYALVLSGGILFTIIRMVSVFFKSRNQGFIF